MKVTYQTCCGVDVHKSFLVATIVKTTGGIEPSYQKKRFSTFNNSILEFKQWLLDNDCHDVCMESTGKYWVPVFNLLEDEINVVIANPKWVKAVKGNKDDAKDSKWIGDLFRLGLVKGSYIPCKKVRILREYTRYRYKLVSCRSSEKNRYQNALTVCNVALDSVVSDIFGKSSTSIIDYLLEQSGTSINHEEIASKLLRSLKSKEDAVIESVEGYQITALKKDFTKDQLQSTVAYQAMSRIGILYKIEELIQDKSPQERQKQSRPVVDAFFEWLHTMEDSVDRPSLIGDAILYALNQEVYLRRYLEDGHLSIDNNSAERAIKNFAARRRNWLFSKSIRGADAKRCRIQYYRDSPVKRIETLFLPYICTGTAAPDGTISKSGRTGPASALVQRLAGRALYKKITLKPPEKDGLFLGVKVRMITCLQRNVYRK